ncbi:MAG: ABC transporter substrate-binding protein [Acetatifactor sp.]
MKKKNGFLKRLAAVVLTAAMVFSVVGCGSSSTSESGSGEEVTIKIGYQPVANDMMIAITEGLLDNMGYSYELVEFSSGKDLNNALASGSVDVGYMGTVPVISGVSSGIEYEVFWISGIITACEGLVVKEGISEVADLAGKNIGVVTGSTSHYSLCSALEKAGVSLDDVTIINGGTTELVAMWERGDIDAAYIWQPSLEAMIKNGGTVIFDGEDSEAIGATTAVVQVVNKSFAEKNPEAVKALVNVLDSVQDYYAENKDKVVADVAAKLEMEESMCKISIEGYRWIPKEEQAKEAYLGGGFAGILKLTADFLAGQGSISGALDEATCKGAISAEYLQ